MADYRLTVALVTRNRPDSLARTLESLRAQSVQPWEILISDDSTDVRVPETAAVAEKFRCRHTRGPCRGLYANRNHAFRQSQGTHVRTMDDDHTFPSGHFELCDQFVQSDPTAIWTTGEIQYLSGKLFDTRLACNQLHPWGGGGPITDLSRNWGIADGSTIYPRTIFDSGRFMVERFYYGASYLEFGCWLYAQGIVSKCVPGAMIEHHMEPATVSRAGSIGARQSQLFTSLCFNRWFRPNPLLAAKYLLSNLILRGLNKELLGSAPSILQMASERWAPVAAGKPNLVPAPETLR